MAISATHYHLLKGLRDAGVLPQGGRILEIGKANWYGDLDPQQILHDFYAGQGVVADTRRGAMERAIRNGDSFGIVRVLYELLCEPTRVASIDMDPSATDCLRLDLNELDSSGDYPCIGAGSWNVVINHGTAEHIFNIANAFRVMHDACAVGGLMIHESPFTGWVDHGFYCLQPTLFWDVAAANGYEMAKVAIEHLASRSIVHVESREQILEMKRRDQLPDNSMLWVAMRKTKDEPFQVPMQGVYAGTVSEAAVNAWRELR